jgi:hypothetical protein
MRCLFLLLLFCVAHVHAQVADIDFHFGISKKYEDCVDFPSLKGYDSIAVVTELDHREMVVRYKDNKLVQVAYLDTLNGYVLATKSFTYGNSGLLTEIEQKESYGYDQYKQIKNNVQVKTMFKIIYEHDSLGRKSKITHVYFNYSPQGYHTDSVFAEYIYSSRELEIRAKEPYGRTLAITFDDAGRVKNRVEYNRDKEVFNEWSFDYGEKRNIKVNFSIHRDALDDESVTLRSFAYVITCDKKGTAIKFFDGKKTRYFRYY